MNQKLENLHSLTVWKSVLSNSIPAMLAMIMVLIYNMADLFFVGQTGDTLQVTAIALAAPIYLVFLSLGNMFGIGGTALASINFGKGNREYVKKISSFCLWASITLAIFASIIIFFNIDNILKLLGASDDVSPLVARYLQTLCFGGPFVAISSCFSNLLRSEGQAGKSMMGMMIGNIVNIILDPIFILVLDYGVSGAAIATVIGNIAAASFYLIYLNGKSTLLCSKFKYFTLDKSIIKGVLAIGFPASLGTILMSLSEILLNNQVSNYGDLAVAGMGVALKVSLITGMLFIGLGQGVQPLLGYSIGAQRIQRYKDIMKFSCSFAFALSLTITLLCYFNLDTIIGSFLSDEKAFEYAYTFSKARLTTSVLFGVFFILLNALQAAGAAKSALLINVSRQGLIFIPTVFILGSMFGLNGLVWVQPVADSLSFILALILYIRLSKHLFEKTPHITEEK